ncbi:hypothetical protein ACIQ9P_12470 [Kitasatospora sp. NPDC094019]|uniref:hypothetical protein n=1 Tax=Kitasatospora sp. NPDC094019 TaxID=3364091 RepID=UPI0038302C8A
MAHRTKLRVTITGACAAMLLAGIAPLTLPAQAVGHHVSAGRTAQEDPRARRQVESFISEYHEATLGQHHEGKNTITVRSEYLTPELDEALTAWTEEHKADPVYRRNEIDTQSGAVDAGSDLAGHEKIVLTMTFEDGTSADVWYQVRTDNYLIDGPQDPTP